MKVTPMFVLLLITAYLTACGNNDPHEAEKGKEKTGLSRDNITRSPSKNW